MQQLLADLVKPHAANRPQHTAICWKDECISYQEFNRLTNQLAHALRTHGCRHGDRVLVLMPNSANAVLAVLGILKASCVAVPLDVKLPSAQLSEVVRECQPPVILVSRSASPTIDELFEADVLSRYRSPRSAIGTLEAFRIEGEHFATAFSGLDILRELPGPLACGAARRAPAFVLPFSAESTVNRISGEYSRTWQSEAIPHAEILSAAMTLGGKCELSEFDRVAISPLSSSPNIVEFFAGLAVGAELHILPDDFTGRPHESVNFVRTQQLTRWLTDDRLLEELFLNELILDGDLPALRQLSWTGSHLSATALMELRHRLPLVEFSRLTKAFDRKLHRFESVDVSRSEGQVRLSQVVGTPLLAELAVSTADD